MSVYGYERATTPRLEAFAREALVFENAFATSAWTVPGIVSLVTGYYPPVHGQNSRYGFYDKAMPTPLRLLAEEGYDVFGSDIKGPGHEDFGYHGKPAARPPFLEAFVEERASIARPFFAWVHLSDLHLPYTPSEENARRWIDTSRSSEGVRAVREHRIILRQPQEGLQHKHAGSVAFVDDDRIGDIGGEVAAGSIRSGIRDGRPKADTAGVIFERELMLDAGVGVFVDHFVKEDALHRGIEFLPRIQVFFDFRERTFGVAG